MTSLTRISITTRKIIRYGIFFAIFLIFAKVTLDTSYRIFRYFFPKPPPAPTVSYGRLPRLPFPPQDKVSLSFTQETPEGSLPKFSGQAKVFFMSKISPNLLSLDSAKDRARGLGFNPDTYEEMSASTYRFTHKTVPSTLEVNIVTGTFSISYNLDADSSPIQRKPPSGEIAASHVRSFLSGGELLPADMTGEAKYQFLKPEGGKLVPALSQSDANLVRINLFRKDYEDLPTLTIDPTLGNVWFLVSGQGERGKQVLAGEYHYFPVDVNQFSTYPLKTADSAWQELVAQKAYVAALGAHQAGDTVKIRRMYLAYFDPATQIQFMEPIFVFSEDVANGFVAYLPAVAPDYYGE